MKRRMKMKSSWLAVALAVALVSGCDWVNRGRENDGQDKTYRAAMADYSAGRLDVALKGFEKVLSGNPQNTLARFQLACLLQDHVHDFLGAVCHYREYLLQAPNSDKASMVRERYAMCERMLATDLAKRMKLGDDSELVDENARLRGASEKLSRRVEALATSLKEAEKRVTTLLRENERLRHLVGAIGEDGEEMSEPLSDAALAAAVAEAGPDDEMLSRPSDMAEARAEELRGESELADAAGSTLLPPASGQRPAARSHAPAQSAPSVPAKPDFYEVQDGDTLYRIALRFYGRQTAWKEIREANKAIVGPNARVVPGQKLRLP